MADAPASAKSFGFLSEKVGPAPLWMWMAAGIGVWYFLLGGKGGKSSSPAATTSQTGYGTDPAGNTGYIDPQSGYVYGSAEDIASLQQQGQVAANEPAPSSTSGSTTAGQYADNNAWGQAAVNYLVARGIDPTQANQAIQLYLAGQTLTTQQQSDVNLAIQGLGSPPSLPGPSSTNPGTVVTPPTNNGGGGSTGGGGGTPKPGQVNQYPAPTGLKVIGTTPTTASVQWNAKTSAGIPTSFTVATYQLNGKRVGYSTVSVPDASAGQESYTVTGLHTKYQYKIEVWANGGKTAPPHATVVATCK